MAGMQRFVTYIYAYVDGQKSSNAGYAKIETRGNAGRIEIHFTTDRTSEGVGKVSFLYIEGGKMSLVPLGELRIEKGQGMVQLSFQTDPLPGTDFGFVKIDGIYITDPDNRMYLSFWRDVEMTDIREPEAGEEKTLEEEVVERTQKEIIEDAEQESLHTMEIPMRNCFPTYSIEEVWKNMQKNYQCVQINEDVCAIQMELSDLRELPRKYWYLGNNSFLLHGFFNYHHILFGQLPNGKWFLGVPGVYERQEHIIASVFGFPGFMPAEEMAIWYHILED